MVKACTHHIHTQQVVKHALYMTVKISEKTTSKHSLKNITKNVKVVSVLISLEVIQSAKWPCDGLAIHLG